MAGQVLLAQLRAAGLTVQLDEGSAVERSILVSPRGAITELQREAIRAEREELVRALQEEAKVQAIRKKICEDARELPVEEKERRFQLRQAWFTGRGRDDAAELAFRLEERDRDLDDRRMCLECAYLRDSGRCAAATVGRVYGASRDLRPIVDLLQRCDVFSLKDGLP